MSSLSYIFVSNGVNGLYNRCFHSRKCSGNDTGQNQDNQSENSYIYIYFCMLYHCRVTGAFEQPIYNLRIAAPDINPMIPEITVMMTDSVSINTRMDLGVAPTALRMPISLLLSLITTNMMLLTPQYHLSENKFLRSR